mmetsp:Transcript_12099/g.15823  ORF Transcript_12099/g.15823 Transcript_12099/m.15823 type:complete len:96 (-) Transcript_12099:256-543(-)|eukprot:CAMPEP_0117758038 /NCGR_PEP_ID=MMETSP0947-20121206/15129_1 /TAXON_ID=44440 /ORGANISM="Chattonella subsalsa, Strain CCMP2191" /LENGTH=95 /DNA_ID=CAMNT_0005578127 /DNA_START=99 /DNA_END=386 /DNA_ORIENTATION=+
MAEQKEDSTLEEAFQAAVERARSWDSPKLTNDHKLKLYSLFKQATIGNVNTSRPGMFDIAGKAKWDAWKSLEGIDQEEAKQQYISELEGQIAELS